jgi:two-component system, NarL family, sensor histidine kinase UhpB
MPESPLPLGAHPWRDVALIIATSALSVVVAAHFQWSESFYALTRRWEYLQLDELSTGLVVLVMGLSWLSWRRYHLARQELGRRYRVEAALERALAENRRLVSEYLRVQEAERKHLARELHDHLGQYLNAVKLDATAIADRCAADALLSEATLDIIRSVDHVHGVVRDMIGRLRPVGLDELGLAAAIEHCVDQWRARLPSTRFALCIGAGLDGLNEPLNLTLYRLIQEALTNIYKHSAAGHVQILLERCAMPEEIHVGIEDDGRGVDMAHAAGGLGIAGMRERVALAGGSFAWNSAPGRGVHIDVRVPFGVPA